MSCQIVLDKNKDVVEVLTPTGAQSVAYSNLKNYLTYNTTHPSPEIIMLREADKIKDYTASQQALGYWNKLYSKDVKSWMGESSMVEEGEPKLFFQIEKNLYSESNNNDNSSPLALLRNATKNPDGTFTVSNTSDVLHIIPGTSNKTFFKAAASAPENVVYTAIFFNTDQVVNTFGQVHPNLYSHHSTIAFKPESIEGLPVGENRSITVVGRLTNDKVDALVVENPLSKNKIPHITLSTADGVRPFESNTELENNQDKIEPLNILLTGVVGYFNGDREVTSRFQNINEVKPTPIKPGVQELFDSNPELSSIGTIEQYSQYLDGIFPESKVKDIVYHGSIYNNKKFKDSTRVTGHYFSTTPKEALQHAQRQLQNPKDAVLYNILLNIKNPKIIIKPIDYEDLDTEAKMYKGDTVFGTDYDSLIAEKVEEYNTTYKTPESTWLEKQIVVFEPEQIHILGSKQDVEGFKKFISASNLSKGINTKFQKISTYTKTSSQNISSILDNLSRRFNIPYIIDTTMPVAGKVVNGVVYVNPNLAGLDTAFHEFAHPFIALYKSQNPSQYQTLVNEVLKDATIMNFVREQNPELSEEDLLEEAVVEAIGRLAAKKLKAKENKGLIKAISRFFENLSKYISKAFNKGIVLNEYTTLEEIADLFLNDNLSLNLSEWSNFDVARYQKRSTNIQRSFDYAFDQLEQMNLEEDAKILIEHTIRKLQNHQKDVIKSSVDGSYLDVSGAPLQRLTDYIDNVLDYGFKPKPGEPARDPDVETDAIVWGVISDTVLDYIIQGTTDPKVIKEKLKNDDKIKDKPASYSDDALDSTIEQLTNLVDRYKENYIILGQVVFTDGKIAGTADIVLIDSLGRITIKDLKTSVKEFNKLGNSHPKVKRYSAQVTGYTALAKTQGFDVTQDVGVDALRIRSVNGSQVEVVELEDSRDLPFLSTVYKSIYTDAYKDESESEVLEGFERVINKVKSALADKISQLEGEKRKGISAEILKYRRILSSIVNVEHVEATVGFINSLYQNVVRNDDPKQNNWTLNAKLKRLVKEIKSNNLDPMDAINKFYVLKTEADIFSGIAQDLRGLQLQIAEEIDTLKSQLNIDVDVNDQIMKLNELIQVFDTVENEFNNFNKKLVSEELGKYITGDGQTDYLENKLEQLEREYKKIEAQIEEEEDKNQPNERKIIKLRRKLTKVQIDYEKVQQQRPTSDNILSQFEKGIFDDLTSFSLRSTATINSSNLILSSFAMKIKRMLLESQSKAYQSVDYLTEYMMDFKQSYGINASNSEEFYDMFIEDSVKEISRDGMVEEDLMFVRDRNYKLFYENFKQMKLEMEEAETSDQRDVIYYNWLLQNTEYKKDVIVKNSNGEDVYLEKSADTLISEMRKELSDVEFEIWWNKHVREVNGSKVINDSRFYKPLKSKYTNEKYELLTKSEKAFEFYNSLLAEYFSAQLKTPKSEMDYSLPNIAKDYASKIIEDGFWTTSNKDVKKSIASLRYGLTEMSKRNISKEIPIPFSDRVKMENKSRNLFSSILAYTYEANLYEGRNEMKFFAETLSDILKQTDVYVTDSFGKRVLKKSNKILSKMNDPEFEEAYEVKKGGNIADFIDDYIEKHIFGVDEVQDFVRFNIELNQLSSKVMGVVAFTQLGGLNVVPAVAQRLQGAVLNRIEAYANQYISRSSWLKASTMHAKYYATESMKDFTNPLKKSLIGQILEFYNPYQESFLDAFGQSVDGKFAKRILNKNSLFFFMRQAETPKAVMMLAVLEEKKILTKSGEEVSLLDAYELDSKGKIKFKDDIDTTSLDLLSNGIVDVKSKNRGDALNKGIHGIMNSFDAPEYKRYWYGKLLFFYRNWVIPGFQKRFKKFHYDIELGDHSEGMYRIFYDKLISDTKELGVLFLDTFRTDKQSGYTDFEKVMIRKAAIEMAFIMATGALTMLLTSLAEGEDDEEYKKALSYMLFFTMRLNSELSFYGGLGDPREGFVIPPINDARKMITQPTFVYPYIDKTIRLFKQLGNPTETYDRKSGMFDKGDSKLLARFYSMFGVSGISANPDELIKVLQLQTN